jgi:hypothetical protein
MAMAAARCAVCSGGWSLRWLRLIQPMRRWSVAPTHAPTADTAKRTAWMLAAADAGEAKRKPRRGQA